jgi:hypothetical protein
MADSGSDPVLRVDPEALQRNGVNMQQFGADIEEAIRLYERTVAAYPPEQAFGTNDDIAKSCWQYVYPAMKSGREIMAAFRAALSTLGQDTGTLGGVFDHANHDATSAAQSSEGHTHH